MSLIRKRTAPSANMHVNWVRTAIMLPIVAVFKSTIAPIYITPTIFSTKDTLILLYIQSIRNIEIIIPTLPESEVIEPDEPLPEEGKLPNPNFCIYSTNKYLCSLKKFGINH